MILSAHQPQYLPWLGYFDKIAKSDCFVFLDQVQYKPREFQNRNKIRTQNGWIWLSVPVVSKGHNRQKLSEVVVNNDFPWKRKHLTSLKVWYGSSNLFNQYFPFFEKVYGREWKRLVDLNVHIIKHLLKELAILRPIYFESQMDIANKSTDRIIEICKKLKADGYLSGVGGRQYLEEEKFKKAKINLIYQDFVHPVYHQQFMKDRNDFIAYMSVLDLLFNEGTKSREILGLS